MTSLPPIFLSNYVVTRRSLLSNIKQTTYSLVHSSLFATKHNQAVFALGNGIALCRPSRVRLACLSSSARLSSSQRATSATALCARASSVSIRAAFSACWLLFRQASSSDWSEFSLLSKRKSSGGRFMAGATFPGRGTVRPRYVA